MATVDIEKVAGVGKQLSWSSGQCEERVQVHLREASVQAPLKAWPIRQRMLSDDIIRDNFGYLKETQKCLHQDPTSCRCRQKFAR